LLITNTNVNIRTDCATTQKKHANTTQTKTHNKERAPESINLKMKVNTSGDRAERRLRNREILSKYNKCNTQQQQQHKRIERVTYYRSASIFWRANAPLAKSKSTIIIECESTTA